MIPVSKPCVGKGELFNIEMVFNSGWLGCGKEVKKFEKQCKDYLCVDNFTAVNTGTSAIHLALETLGVGPGDEVIIPSLTFVATAQAVLMSGADPVFCDVSPESFNIDPEEISKLITEKTAAIIPVHYRGQPCDMESIMAVRKNAFVIEDAAHAFGSKIKTRGHAACYSFDPIKNITCGEGGGIVFKKQTNEHIAMVDRNLGRFENNVISNGWRYHMSNINAAIGLWQLHRADSMIEHKKYICKRYDVAFGLLKNLWIIPMDYDISAPFMYVVRIKNNLRYKFMKAMKEKGIETGIHYAPCHKFRHFKNCKCGDLRFTDSIENEIMTLPCYPDMTKFDIEKVIQSCYDVDSKL